MVRDVEGGENRVKKAVIVLAVALMVASMLATPVMALGPAKNSHAELNLGAVFLDSGKVTHEWVQDGRINTYIDAKPNYKGIMNNVNLVVDSGADLAYLGQNAPLYMGMSGWIYLSGEMTEGGTWLSPMFPSEGKHGAFYWFLRIFAIPPEVALELASNHLYGVYLGGHDLGWS